MLTFPYQHVVLPQANDYLVRLAPSIEALLGDMPTLQAEMVEQALPAEKKTQSKKSIWKKILPPKKKSLKELEAAAQAISPILANQHFSAIVHTMGYTPERSAQLATKLSTLYKHQKQSDNREQRMKELRDLVYKFLRSYPRRYTSQYCLP
jgi:hypothetical protein